MATQFQLSSPLFSHVLNRCVLITHLRLVWLCVHWLPKTRTHGLWLTTGRLSKHTSAQLSCWTISITKSILCLEAFTRRMGSIVVCVLCYWQAQISSEQWVSPGCGVTPMFVTPVLSWPRLNLSRAAIAWSHPRTLRLFDCWARRYRDGPSNRQPCSLVQQYLFDISAYTKRCFKYQGRYQYLFKVVWFYIPLGSTLPEKRPFRPLPLTECGCGLHWPKWTISRWDIWKFCLR